MKRLGFIGAGRMAQHHARAALACGAEVRHVYCSRGRMSPHAEAFTSICGDIDFLPTTTAVIESAETEAVVVAAPWDIIPAMLPELAASPKPMLIEKPIALDVPTLDRLPSPAYTDNKAVAFNRRFYETIACAREMLQEETPLSAEFVMSEHVRVHTERYGSGVIDHLLAFTSVHTIDLINYLFGVPRWVPGSVVRDVRGRAINALLISQADVPIHVSWHLDDPSPVGLMLRWSGRALHISPLEAARLYDGVQIEDKGAGRTYQPRCTREIACDMTHKPGIMLQMQAFLQQRDGLAGIDDARAALQLIEDLRL